MWFQNGMSNREYIYIYIKKYEHNYINLISYVHMKIKLIVSTNMEYDYHGFGSKF
jgi:hypothetical protein